MNILIVNAFGTSESSKLKFAAFCSTIDVILKKVSYKSGIGNFMYSYRTVNTLDDFVYNLPSNKKVSENKKAEYKKHFDKLDMIFIDGNEKNYLPWENLGTKLLYFVRLCIKKKKILFASGVGMLHLIYNLATNFTDKNIINSNGELPTIEDLSKIPIQYTNNLKKEDGFLDYATGDIYELTHNEWVPVMNIGIHKLIYAEKFRERGRFVLKEYKLNKDPDMISSVKKEIKTHIYKQYCLHWLVRKLKFEFVAYTSLTWYIHNICVNDEDLSFKTICDSNFGPTVIEHGHCIGCIFHIMKKFPETVELLENFIRKKFVEVQVRPQEVFEEVKRFDDEAVKLFRTVVPDFSNYEAKKNDPVLVDAKLHPKSTIGLVNQGRLFGNVKKDKGEGPHCGLSYNTRDMIFLENNNVIKKKIPLSELGVPNDPGCMPTLKTLSQAVIKDDYDYLKIDPMWDDEEIINYYKKKGREICEKLQEVKNTDDTHVKKLTKNFLSTRPKTGFSSSFGSGSGSGKNSSSMIMSKKLSSANMSASKRSVRPSSSKSKMGNKGQAESESVLTMLFPYIKEEDFTMKEFNPGIDETKNLEVVRVNLETRIKSNFNKKFKKYDKELNTFGDKPSIRCSSAYMTEDEAKRREFIESKKLWMCPEDFRRVFGKLTLANQLKEQLDQEVEYNKNFNNATEPPALHQFRSVDKSKWVNKRGFIV